MTRFDALFETRWVHVFEEDGPEGEVYRPEGSDIPLSRRPRQALVFLPDGSARLFLPGPADRPREVEARWAEEGEAVAVRVTGRGELHVSLRSADCLVLRR